MTLKSRDEPNWWGSRSSDAIVELRGLGDVFLFEIGFTADGRRAAARGRIEGMERKVFWATFIVLGLIADFTMPIIWSLLATIPIGMFSWWVAYRSEWF
jgi:hypothetical protein